MKETWSLYESGSQQEKADTLRREESLKKDYRHEWTKLKDLTKDGKAPWTRNNGKLFLHSGGKGEWDRSLNIASGESHSHGRGLQVEEWAMAETTKTQISPLTLQSPIGASHK